MKKRYTEEQIGKFLKGAERGVPVKELCRKHGFSEPSYYAWRNKSAAWMSRMPSA